MFKNKSKLKVLVRECVCVGQEVIKMERLKLN